MTTRKSGGGTEPPANDEVPASSEPSEATSSAHPMAGRRAHEILRELWYQNSGPGTAKDGTPLPPGKQVVDGLDGRELILGVALTALDLVFTVLDYFFHFKHSPTASIRRDATSYLLAGLVGCGLMVLGTAFRRRALLGFASFITGFAMISFGGIEGVFFLFFGGWLVLRVMRKQKQDQPRSRSARPAEPASRRGSPAAANPKAPGASKRYTPPRRARAASGRKR